MEPNVHNAERVGNGGNVAVPGPNRSVSLQPPPLPTDPDASQLHAVDPELTMGPKYPDEGVLQSGRPPFRATRCGRTPIEPQLVPAADDTAPDRVDGAGGATSGPIGTIPVAARAVREQAPTRQQPCRSATQRVDAALVEAGLAMPIAVAS